MDAGDNIRYMRKKLGLSRKRLAELSGVAEITISQYENHKRQPKIKQLQKISAILGTTIDFLLSGEVQGNDYTYSVRIADAMLSKDPVGSTLEDIAKRPRFVPAPGANADNPMEFTTDPTTEDAEFLWIDKAIKNGSATHEEIMKYGRMNQVRAIYFREFLDAFNQHGTKMLVESQDAKILENLYYTAQELKALDIIEEEIRAGHNTSLDAYLRIIEKARAHGVLPRDIEQTVNFLIEMQGKKEGADNA